MIGAMRRGMAALGNNSLEEPRNQANMDGDENASNGTFNKAKRTKQAMEEARTSTSQSTLNLVNCILGAGVLGYPFCFRSCGLLLGTLIMVVSYAATRFSYNLLLYCSQISNKRTYEELAEQAVGKAGRQIVQLCTAALNLGCIVAYLNILADVLSAVAGTIIPPGAEPSRNAYITGVSLFGALPVALWVRDHATIATFMMASVGFVILFSVVVVIFAMAPHPATAAVANAVAMWQPEGLLVAFPVIVYSFTAHPYYLGIFNNLHNATFSRMTRVTNVAMGLSGVLYWVVGVFGYLTFRNRTAGDLLRNFGAANVDGLRGAYERAIKLCYGLSILGSMPLVILPFYSLMLPMLGFSGRGDYALGGGGAGTAKRTNSGSVSEMEEAERHGASFSHGGSVTGGGPPAGRRSLSKLGRAGSHEVDVVDLKLHADRDGGTDEELQFSKHAILVVIVLGTSLATAIWVPNIEFIYGLTGATASVLLSYILPAMIFIKLMDANPELLGGGNFKVIPESVRSEWLWRKRKAIALLCFGVVSGITCTDAILGAVKQEAAVVHLAQQLVAHEVVVAETAKVQQKARAAVTAMSAVEMAAKELGQANVSATGTFTKLQQAAAQLDTVAGANATVGGHSGKSSHEWGIQSFVKEHKQHVAETKVFKAVELALNDVKDEVRRTAAGVSGVIAQLDAAIAQLSSGEAAAAVGGGVNATSGAGAGTAASSSSQGGGSSRSARDRAGDLALELGKALGEFSDVAGNVTAGKSLSQVRSTAMSTLLALNQTAAVLDHVSASVEAARRSNKHDDEIKKAAVAAMQLALNATATSALAMQLTGEALQKSATEEASELLDMLVKVSKDLEKSSVRSKVARTKRIDPGVNATATAAATGAATTAAGVDSAAGALVAGISSDSSTAAAAAAGGGGGGVAASAGGGGGGTSSSSGAVASDGSTSSATADKGSAGAGSSGTAGGSGATMQAPLASPNSDDKAAEAAGQLEQVIKDLNSKIAAAAATSTVAPDTATTAAAAAAAAAAATAAATAVSSGTISATGVVTTTTAAGTGAGVALTGPAASSRSSSTAGALVDTSGGSSGGGGGAGASTGAAKADQAAAAGAAVAAAATAALLSGNVSSGAGTGAAGGLSSGLNVSGIAAALQDAVAVTKVKQDEALHEIQESLTNTNSKVAERVVDILKDISETKKETLRAGGKAGATGTTGIEAVLNTGGSDDAAAVVTGGVIAETQDATAADASTTASSDSGATSSSSSSAAGSDAGSSSSSSSSTTSSTSATGTLEGALFGLVHKITETVEDKQRTEDVVGPVVKVDAEGHLVQEDGDGDGIVGPTVKDTDAGRGHSSDSSASSTHAGDGSSTDAVSGADHAKLNRKLGLGSVLSKPG